MGRGMAQGHMQVPEITVMMSPAITRSVTKHLWTRLWPTTIPKYHTDHAYKEQPCYHIQLNLHCTPGEKVEKANA